MLFYFYSQVFYLGGLCSVGFGAAGSAGFGAGGSTGAVGVGAIGATATAGAFLTNAK